MCDVFVVFFRNGSDPFSSTKKKCGSTPLPSQRSAPAPLGIYWPENSRLQVRLTPLPSPRSLPAPPNIRDLLARELEAAIAQAGSLMLGPTDQGEGTALEEEGFPQAQFSHQVLVCIVCPTLHPFAVDAIRRGCTRWSSQLQSRKARPSQGCNWCMGTRRVLRPFRTCNWSSSMRERGWLELVPSENLLLPPTWRFSADC